MNEQEAGQYIDVQFNVFGLSIEPSHVEEVFEYLKTDAVHDDPRLHDRICSLRRFFGSARRELTRDQLNRYLLLTERQTGLGVTPVGHVILDQQILPSLIAAKRMAALGDYLASIALSGYVSEVLTMLVWEAKFKYKYEVRSKTAIGSFAKLTQAHRLSILNVFGCLGEDDKIRLTRTSKRRNDALHPWTSGMNEENLEDMAVENFADVYNSLHNILGISLADAGSINIDPDFLRILS